MEVLLRAEEPVIPSFGYEMYKSPDGKGSHFGF
jgi:hypothetical protein